MKPKIIGTGLSGLVGSRIVELLSDKYNFIDLSLDTGVDILNYQQLDEVFKLHTDASVVIHLAAFTDTTAAWKQKDDKSGLCYQLNVMGTKNILQYCRNTNKYLIHFSTDFVFDGQKSTAYTEEDKPRPIDWYGQTKYKAEQEVLASRISAAIIRIATPFRASFEPKKDLVNRILDGLRTKTLYPMFTDQISTPTYIDDIATAIDYFIQKKPTGVFHAVGSSSQSAYELAVIIAQTWGLDPSIIKKGSLAEYLKTQTPDSRPWQQSLILSNAKITNLGLSFKTTTASLLDMKKQMR